GAWKLDKEARALAVDLFETTAEGNAVVVADLLVERGVAASVRTVQRAVAPHRRAQRAAEAATVRFETEPGHQLQIDFGEKWVVICGERTKGHLLTAGCWFVSGRFVKAVQVPG